MAESAITIRNCKFSFRCTRTWDSLRISSEDNIRHCDDCKEDVHLCETNEELVEAIRNDRCVAIVLTNEQCIDNSASMFVGLVEMPYESSLEADT